VLARRFLIALLAALCAAAPFIASAAPQGPDAVITPIYKKVTAGKGDRGGQFVWLVDKDRRLYFTARTVKLWRDADAKTPKGDQGPISFDPVTNSQDPRVKAFDVAIEKQDATSATVVVHIAAKPGPITPTPPWTIRYDMVREHGRWLIDDIRGTINTEWSLRKMLSAYRG
jgi:hypothetical protein